jgi:flagellar biosynthesis/type III secretory pathway ATPase
LLKGKAQPATLRLVEVALEGFGGRSFESSLTRLVELTAAKRDREVAYVTVAKPLDRRRRAALAAKLSGIYGRQVSLKVDVDPASSAASASRSAPTSTTARSRSATRCSGRVVDALGKPIDGKGPIATEGFRASTSRRPASSRASRCTSRCRPASRRSTR